MEKCKPSIWNIMLHFFWLWLHTNERRRSLEECEGHHEFRIPTASAKLFMPERTREFVKPLLITTLLTSIALVLFSNCFVSMDLWLLVTSNWKALQIFLLFFILSHLKVILSSCSSWSCFHEEDCADSLLTSVTFQENYALDKWMLQTLFRMYLAWISPVFQHSAKPVTFALEWS